MNSHSKSQVNNENATLKHKSRSSTIPKFGLRKGQEDEALHNYHQADIDNDLEGSESGKSDIGSDEEHIDPDEISSSSIDSSINTTSSCSTHSNVFSSVTPRTNVSGQPSNSGSLIDVSSFHQQRFRHPSVFKILFMKMGRFASKYHKELTLFLFLLTTALSLVKKGPAKIQAASSPRPFFSRSASKYVQDNFNGDYIDLARSIPYIPTFVFYYAPWDSESLDARNEFLSVANHFYKTQPGLIKFVGVNCWYMSGQCRQNYKNLSHFPIFVMHVMSSNGVIYNGPIRSQPMIRFIHLALNPMTRLDSEEHVWNFRSQHDVLMLTYFNFTNPNASQDYDTFRQVALRSLESDAFGQVGFGIFLRPTLAEKYYLSSSSNSISLVLFNEVHTAKWSGGFHDSDSKGGKGPVSQIIDWLTERTSKLPLTWLYSVRNGFANRPAALGPFDLTKEMANQPLLLLITKRYYPSSYSPFYSQVKEVALDYFNCNGSGNVTKLRRTIHKLTAEWMQLWKSVIEVCQNPKTSTSNCKILLPQLMLNHWKQKRIYYRKDSISNYENVSSALNFTGLSCQTKRPLRFIAIDPTDVPHFLDLAFGFNVNADVKASCNIENRQGNKSCRHEKDSYNGGDPIAFFVDAQNEYLMPFSNFNISELALAIHNFTKETRNGPSIGLSSHLVSEVADSSPIDTQLVKKFTSEDLIDYLSKAKSLASSSSSLFLMYTAQFCGFCSVVLTQFVSLGKFLQNYDINVTLGKIDTFKNTLPSNLAPEAIPTLVLYSTSSSRNSTDGTTMELESRVFPANEEITTKSLLKFLLSELDPKMRVNLSLTASARQCDENEIVFRKSDCLDKSKASITRQIEVVLGRLGTELGFELTTLEEDTSKIVNETEIFKLSRPISIWEADLLDHLRSVKLTLDLV